MSTRQNFSTDRATISYESHGTGPAVVLIQGLGMPGPVWAPFASRLRRHGFRTIMPDNCGTGLSTHDHGIFYSMREYAQDVSRVLDRELEPEERAYVVGISLGGMVAQHVALQDRDRVAGLMLIATTCGLPHNLMGRAFFRPQALLLLARACFMAERTGIEGFSRLLAHEGRTREDASIFGDAGPDLFQDAHSRQDLPSPDHRGARPLYRRPIR